MAKSKSKRPSKKHTKVNLKAKKNLQAIGNIQKFMAKFCISGVMSDPKHTLLFKDGIPVAKTKAVSDAFYNIRFQWTILLGVLCRTPQGKLYTRQVTYVTSDTDHVLADELNDNVAKNLRKLWKTCNQDHVMQAYYFCTPSDTFIPNTYVAQLLHHYRTPDIYATRYELTYMKNEPAKQYCINQDGSPKIWQELFVDIDFNDINMEIEPLVFTRLAKAERYKQQLEREIEALQEKIEDGKRFSKLFTKTKRNLTQCYAYSSKYSKKLFRLSFAMRNSLRPLNTIYRKATKLHRIKRTGI